MKFPEGWALDRKDPLIIRAHEIVNDLILEYGVPIVVNLETSCYHIPSAMWEGISSETVTFISGVQYCVGEHTFETIRELRKALENKAFM